MNDNLWIANRYVSVITPMEQNKVPMLKITAQELVAAFQNRQPLMRTRVRYGQTYVPQKPQQSFVP